MEFYQDGLLEDFFALNSTDLDSIVVPFPTINAAAANCFQDHFLPMDSSFGALLPFDSNLHNQTIPYFQQHQHDHSITMPFLDDPNWLLNPGIWEETPPQDSVGFDVPQKNRVRKLHGHPSKNLMAERRRRKRLNDRLSMLRSVVPKISKMDRTSILGDTIDYMKELLERIHNLEEDMQMGANQSLITILNDAKPNETSLVRTTPKFEVERRDKETRIEMRCVGKPGLLLSTVTTLEEALGLEIQHCVLTCFNDFALQASCIQDTRKRGILESEEIKQALLKNAGYMGRGSESNTMQNADRT